MRISVFAWDANPAVDRRLYPVSVTQAVSMLAEKRVQELTLPDGRRALQKLPPLEILEKRAARSLVPFGRVYDKLMHPPKLNYSVPAVADRNLSWHWRFMHVEKQADACA